MNSNSYLIEKFGKLPSPVLFIDFDGTISEKDVIDAILEEFADQRWLEIEEKWISGEIGSRECLQKQFQIVRATPEELNEFLLSIKLDEDLPNLLEFVEKNQLATHIVSDGFDYYIEMLLARYARNFPRTLKKISVWANRLKPHNRDEWKTEFPFFQMVCNDGCATCKPAVMELVNHSDAPRIFIGDGLSDRYAAQNANLVFAKKKLRKFCCEQSIAHFAYKNLGDVTAELQAIWAAREIEQYSRQPKEIFDVIPLSAGT